MYQLARITIGIGIMAMLWTGAVTVLLLASTIPLLGIIAVITVGVILVRRRIVSGGIWSSEDELRRAEMVEREEGLLLGRLQGKSRGRLLRAVGGLMNLPAKAACEEFMRSYQSLLLKKPGPLVRMPRSAVHSVVFSPTGGGKGVSCVIPFLMSSRESCCVIDFKGDLSRITAAHRRKMGQKVVILDPFGITGYQSDTLNPLDGIEKTSPTAVDDCFALATSLVLRPMEEGKNKHFDDSAEEEIAGFAAATVYYGTGNSRSLQEVDAIATNGKLKESVTAKMCEPDENGVMPFDGLLARMGGKLGLYTGEERNSIASTTARHLRFLRSPAIAANTRTTSFDPRLLCAGKMTVYLVLPPEYMRSHAGWLRMGITSMFRVVVRGGLSQRKVNFVLDEAASLGNLEPINDALDKYRAYGVRCQFYYQSLGQLKTCFPADEGQTLLSNCSKTFFGVNDLETAKMCSELLGKQRVIMHSGSKSWGGSLSSSEGMHANKGHGWNWGGSSNWNEEDKEVLRPEQIMNLPQDTALHFIPGIRPLTTRLIKYFDPCEAKWLKKATGGWYARTKPALDMFAWSLMYCYGMLTLAVIAAYVAMEFHPLERFEWFFRSLDGGY